MPRSEVQIENLSYRYGTRTVLHQISVSIPSNTLTAVLGPNGAGKSTLLKSINGLLKPAEGQITLNGKDVQAYSKRQLAQCIATVPQETRFSFPFTALEIVLMGRHPYQTGAVFESDQDIKIALSALEQCDALEFAERDIQTLSAGEKQRVIFAKAIAQKATLILLDEPGSNLDIRYELELYELTRELASKQKCTVLTVMHDINLAIEFCDEIILMKNGKIIASGKVLDVIDESLLAHAYDTKIHISTNPVNGKPLVLPGNTQGTTYLNC